MQLSEQRIEKFRRSIELALNREWPELSKAKQQVAALGPRLINLDADKELQVIATVATDGGESRLVLDPIRMHIVRIADSSGNILCEDFVPLSLNPEELLRFFFRSNETLQRFLNFLNLSWEDLLPSDTARSPNLLQMLRELMEWAALMRLAFGPKPKLLVRDGLLRSVLLPDAVFGAIQVRFKELTNQRGHLLAGVSKRSQIVNYLSTGLALDERFQRKQPFYVQIPVELERATAPPRYTWGSGRAMGHLFLARLDHGENVPLMPVDVARWQADRAEEAMMLLAQDSKGSFPVRGYPQALIAADRHARIGGLEVELLERLVLGELAERDPTVARQAQEQMLLGKRLSQSFENGRAIGDF